MMTNLFDIIDIMKPAQYPINIIKGINIKHLRCPLWMDSQKVVSPFCEGMIRDLYNYKPAPLKLLLYCAGLLLLFDTKYMKHTRVTKQIEYIEPSNAKDRLVCSGIIIHSTPKIVIDTNPGDAGIVEILKKLQPDIAIITHFHIDHSGYLSAVSKHTNARIYIPKKDEPYLVDIENYIEQLRPDNSDIIEKLLRQRLIESGYMEIKEYNSYDEATDFRFHNPDFMRVIRTPGHSPGHSSFYFPHDKILFTGDIGTDKLGPWYIFPNCNLAQHIESILRLMTLDIDLMITCHGGIISKGIKPALRQCLKIIYDRECMIKSKLEKGYARSKIVEEGIIFGNKTGFDEPMRSYWYNGDDTAFNHHYNLIQNGGMINRFPVVYDMLIDI